MRGYLISYSNRAESNGFDVFVQSHTKEVLDLPPRRETRPFVEPDGPRERRSCIEADPLAVCLSEMCLCMCQQSRGNTAALRGGTYCHSSNVAFSRLELEKAFDAETDVSAVSVATIALALRPSYLRLLIHPDESSSGSQP